MIGRFLSKFFFGGTVLVICIGPLPGQQQQTPTTPGAVFRDMDMSQRETLGQATTEKEHQVWQNVVGALDTKVKAKAAQDYLDAYPEGGFAAYAHEILAVYARQNNDLKGFFEHGEKAIAQLPDSVALLASLSAAYADDMKPEPALERGRRALELLPTMERPPEYMAETWPQRRKMMMGDAHYGVGTALLFKAFNSNKDPKLMAEALDNLVQATQLDLRDERSLFRLGFGYQLKGDLKDATLQYARACALNGPNSFTARQYLEQTYTAVNGSTKGLDKFIDEQKKFIDEEVKKLEQQ
jgi:hypothetical protein